MENSLAVGSIPVYGISIVNSEGFMDGSESYVEVFSSLQESLDYAFEKYKTTWNNLKNDGVLSGQRMLSKKGFMSQMVKLRGVNIQLDDCHISFERFETELKV